MQWVDSASLKLIQLLMNEANQGYLLLIGAYRDNEVFPAHTGSLLIVSFAPQNTTLQAPYIRGRKSS